MKTEKEILAEFVGLVFGNDDIDSNDTLSKSKLLNGSLSSVRIVANNALEISGYMKKSEQDKLNSSMIAAGFSSLYSFQDKAFRAFLRILNRGNIQKLEAFRLVKAISETNLLTEEHRNAAYFGVIFT